MNWFDLSKQKVKESVKVISDSRDQEVIFKLYSTFECIHVRYYVVLWRSWNQNQKSWFLSQSAEIRIMIFVKSLLWFNFAAITGCYWMEWLVFLLAQLSVLWSREQAARSGST